MKRPTASHSFILNILFVIIHLFVCFLFCLLLQSPASLRVLFTTEHFLGLPWWLCCKEPTCQCRRCEFDPWLNKFPWRRKCNPLQYSCLQNCMDRGVWWATFHGIAKDLDTTQQLNNSKCILHSKVYPIRPFRSRKQ